MGIPSNYANLDESIIHLIKFKSWTLIGKIGYTFSDRDDIEQELAVHIVDRLKHFDPSRGKLSTFVSRVVDNKIASMIEARKTRKLDFRSHAYSLDELMRDPNGELFRRGDEIEEDDYLMRTDCQSRSTQELVELRSDLARVISTLPEDMQSLCACLMTQNVTDISREMGVSRQKIYDSIRSLRTIFRAAGLDEYV